MFVFGLVQVAATRAAAEDAYHAVKKGTVFTLFYVVRCDVVSLFDHREALRKLTEKKFKALMVASKLSSL